ncbi:MAG: type IV pilin protein [Acidobacteriota bacterium]
MKESRGFSFIELLMVVSVISILAAMSVPHLQKMKMGSQERVALATIRTFFKGEAMYLAQFQTFGDFDGLISNEFIDNSFASGSKAGYSYAVQNPSQTHFEVIAVPLTFGVSGEKSFYIDETGVIRYNPDGSLPGPQSLAFPMSE